MDGNNSADMLREYQIKSGYKLITKSFLINMINMFDVSSFADEAFKKKYVKELEDLFERLPTCYQNPLTFQIVEDLFKKIEKASAIISNDTLSFPDKITYGTANINSFTAFVESGVRENDYLILLSDALFTFANLMAKSVGLLLVTEKNEKNGYFQFSFSVDHIDRVIENNYDAIIRFTDLIMAYIITRSPEKAQQYTPNKRLASISSLIRDSFELFVVGHEYSHILLGHLKNNSQDMFSYISLNDEKIKVIANNWKEEIEADQLAALLTIIAMKGFDFASSYVGVDISLIVLIILERIQEEIYGDKVMHMSHPPAEIRRNLVYENLVKQEPSITSIYESNSYILDVLWTRSKFIISKLNNRMQEIFKCSIYDLDYDITRRILYRTGEIILKDYDKCDEI